MKPLRFAAGLLLVIAALSSLPAAADDSRPWECLVLDIHEIGHPRLGALTATAGIDSWVELDEELFVCGSARALADLGQRATVRRSLGRLASDRLRIANKLSRAELERRGLRVLAAGGLFAIVETPESFAARGDDAPDLLPYRSRLVLARQVANQPARKKAVAGRGTVAELVATIEPGRWLAGVDGLAAYNRYSLGSEINLARRWLERQFRRLPGVSVESRVFQVEGVQVANVIATLPGRSRPDDWFIVGGHYDSTSEDPFAAAPGAEDNASGCAGVLEMARVFAANPPEATILFICYAGEEQGLTGSTAHVAELLVSGDEEKVAAMLNLDMIGFSADADLDCLLQYPPPAQYLVEAMTDSAARHTRLRLVTSNMVGGSDHVPYSVAAIPAVLSIENDWSVYPHYHRTTDTPDKLTPEMAAEILRMNVGALARFTGNSDVTGCLELDDEPLVGVKISAKQRGRPRRTTHSDPQGCFAVDPLARGRSFQLRITGPLPAGSQATVSGCVRLLGGPLEEQRVIFRQPGEETQRASSGDDGCFAFEAAADDRFVLVLRGPEVSDREE